MRAALAAARLERSHIATGAMDFIARPTVSPGVMVEGGDKHGGKQRNMHRRGEVGYVCV